MPQVRGIVSGALTPVLSTTLTELVDPQLKAVGVGLGEMDVTVMGAHGFAPQAFSDAATTSEDTAVSIPVLANDTDRDGDPFTISSVTQGSHGTVVINAGGTVTYTPDVNFNGTDTFTYEIADGDGCTASASYTPAPNFHGTDSFRYTISDGNGGSSTASVTVSVSPVNDAPQAADDAVSTSEDTPLTVVVLGNDADVDGDALTISSVTQGAHGTVVVNADGTLSYTPAPDFDGMDSFRYTVSDGQGGTASAMVTITVSPVNDVPVAVNDSYTTAEGQALGFAAPGVLSNDSDGDGDTLATVLVSGPAHGTLTMNSDGSLTYTPAASYNGDDSFTYQVSDGQALSNVATVRLTVNAVNDAPVANDDSYTVAEDSTLTVAAPGVLGNDSDVDGDTLSTILGSGPLHGNLVLNGDGSFTYAPAADYNGSDSFTYRAFDGTASSTVATVSIIVKPVNDAPVANTDSATMNEDTAVIIAVLADDSDVDGDSLTVASLTSAAHGTVVLNADNTLTYTPAVNYFSGDSFDYTVSDGHGGSATATVSITVPPVNDAPVSQYESLTTAEDTLARGSVAATDADGDVLSYSVVSGPAHGSLAFNPDGSFSYVPAPDFSGSDSFTFQAHDGQADSNVATVSISVTAVDDAAVAVNDHFLTDEDTPLTVAAPGVLGNDSDVDSPTLTTVLVSGPMHGALTLNVDGSFSYTPFVDYNGSDSFTYQASDGALGSNVTTVSLSISPVNDAPVARGTPGFRPTSRPRTVKFSIGCSRPGPAIRWRAPTRPWRRGNLPSVIRTKPP
ncbi:MAG: tandem-95 repeat protein [Planctomycetes bacterium]|nr:tandem-95 repeat protein [Planctomycetota bacterium]